MNTNQIGEQLLNLSMQLLSDGIQAFNIGKSMITMTNIDFWVQLQNISNQINSIINENNMKQIQRSNDVSTTNDVSATNGGTTANVK